MTPAGLIYALIVGVWAAVLLPRWTRRHSDAAAERFAGQAAPTRVLARRGRSPVRGHGSVDAEARARREAKARARVRRARVLVGLLLTTVVTAVLAAFSFVPSPVFVVPALLLGGYVIALRSIAVQDHRADGVRRQRAHTDMAPTAPPVGPDPVTSSQVEASQGLRDEQVIDLRDRPYDAERDSAAEWEPRQAPLPTYVSKNEQHRRSIIFGGGPFGTEEAAQQQKKKEQRDGDASGGASRAVND